MKAKTILIGAGIALLAGVAFAAKKLKTLQAVFDEMTISPADISDFKVKGTFPFFEIHFKLDIKITNPTTEAFSVSGASLAVLKSISIYRKGEFLAKADLNLTELIIQPKSSVVIKYIPFTASAVNVLQNALTMSSININELTIIATVEVLGTEYEIEG